MAPSMPDPTIKDGGTMATTRIGGTTTATAREARWAASRILFDNAAELYA